MVKQIIDGVNHRAEIFDGKYFSYQIRFRCEMNDKTH